MVVNLIIQTLVVVAQFLLVIHKRQERDNVVYTGNAFPHNYSDAWDDERGMMILDWDGTKQFIAEPDPTKVSHT